MTKLRDVMEQDNDPHVKEWGPFLGPSGLLPEFMGVCQVTNYNLELLSTDSMHPRT